MNEAASISTWDLLQDFGFEPDGRVFSDVLPGRSLDFGNFKLSASCVMNMSFRNVVLFTGVLVTPRTQSEVRFEMPRQVKSREQCAAWIVWHLDRASDWRGFRPERDVRWVTEGRLHQNLLPWVAQLAAYEARPKCMVQRDWLRVALKMLKEIVTLAETEAAVMFGFDGTVLIIRCSGKVVPLPADGQHWPKQYTIPAGNLRHLPNRLMREHVEVSIWEGRLNIGRNRYEGITVAASGNDNDIGAQ
jgi:hypothetical protein